MDSKPIAIIIDIVATVGAMSGATLFATNIFAGITTATDLASKDSKSFLCRQRTPRGKHIIYKPGGPAR